MRAIYVAGKFRGRNHWEVTQNVWGAEAHAFRLARMGAVPLCPHAMFKDFDGTLTDQYWLDATLELLERCDAIAMVPGWEFSHGSVGEHARAEAKGIPIFYLDDVKSEAEMKRWIQGGSDDA